MLRTNVTGRWTEAGTGNASRPQVNHGAAGGEKNFGAKAASPFLSGSNRAPLLSAADSFT